MKKRTLLTVSAVFAFLLLFALAVFAGAEETTLSGTCGETATWRFEEATGTLYIEGSGAMSNYSASNMPWKSLKKDVKKVVFSNDITSIGNNSFSNFASVEEIRLPSALDTIGGYAFNGCTSLTGIELPEGLTTINNAAFANTTFKEIVVPKCVTFGGDNLYDNNAVFYRAGIEKITFEDGIKTIPAYICRAAAMLTDVTIPETVTAIGGYAFSGCTALTEIQLPSALDTIGGYAFNGCTSLTGIELPEGLTTINNAAFANTTFKEIVVPKCVTFGGDNLYDNNAVFYRAGIEKITFEDGIKTIPAYICRAAAMLTDVTIPETVTAIGGCAFSGCTALTEIQLPAALDTIGGYAFNGCTALTGIELPEGLTTVNSAAFANTTFKEIFIPKSVTTMGTTSGDSYAVFYKAAIEKITFEDGTKTIPNYACRAATMLTDVTIPETVTAIGGYAFSGCTALTEIQLPAALDTIGGYAFNGCTALTGIELPEGLTTVNSAAFANTTFKEIFIPKSVTTMGNYSIDGYAVFYKAAIEKITFEDGTKTIPNYACRAATMLTDVTIPDTVTAIGGYAFSGCSSLSGLNLNNTETLGTGAFRQCANLSFVRSARMKEIKSIAFENCPKLEKVILLSMTCKIAVDVFKETDVTVFGLADSDVQSFCVKNDIRFCLLTDKRDSAPVFDDVASGGLYLREQMLLRNDDVYFVCTAAEENMIGRLLDAAFIYDPLLPTAGDYLRWSTTGMECLTGENGYYEFIFSYSTKAAAEKELNERLPELLSELLPGEISEYEKIDRIFDHLRENVLYSENERNDPRTAYSAFTDGKANCQGFAQAFYRLALEAGLNARIVVNKELNHAWNIVQMNGKWYYLDLSSAVSDPEDENDSYFLKAELLIDNTPIVPGYGEGETPTEIRDYDFAQGNYCDHSFAPTYTVSSTCIMKGYTVYMCSLCGDTVRRDYTDLSGHTDKDGDKICDFCLKPVCNHMPEKIGEKEAACTEQGYTGDTVCTLCGKVLIRGEILPALRHSDQNGDGVCDICEKTMPAPGCDHKGYLVRNVQPSTCVEPGYEYYICSACGETVYTGSAFPLTEHTDEDGDGICDFCGGSVHLVRRIVYRFKLSLHSLANILLSLVRFFSKF